MPCYFFAEHLLANLEHYEVIVPMQVDQQGRVLRKQIQPSHRGKRHVALSLDESDVLNSKSSQLHYMLSAYGKSFHLNLTLNTEFLAPNFTVELRGKDGASYNSAEGVTKCHYIGHLKNIPNSRVIISNCLGLVSIIKISVKKLQS